MDLNGKKIAILATNGFEQAELEVPRDRLKKAGATVDVVSLASGEIKGWDKKDWGQPVKIDKTLDEVSAVDYDAVVLPGGQINPDLLRVEAKALKFIKDIFDAKKVVAAVCHAPWLLIETGIAKGRKMTCYKSIKTDLANAGAKWEDFGGRRRPGRHHFAQSGRPGGFQRQDHRRGQGRPASPAQRGLTAMKTAKIAGDARAETRVVILETGEEAFSALTKAAVRCSPLLAAMTMEPIATFSHWGGRRSTMKWALFAAGIHGNFADYGRATSECRHRTAHQEYHA